MAKYWYCFTHGQWLIHKPEIGWSCPRGGIKCDKLNHNTGLNAWRKV